MWTYHQRHALAESDVAGDSEVVEVQHVWDAVKPLQKLPNLHKEGNVNHTLQTNRQYAFSSLDTKTSFFNSLHKNGYIRKCNLSFLGATFYCSGISVLGMFEVPCL